ncbi:DUF4256 domain-containing protein [Mucilaginibacter auburnensis]|uniref:Uncharacterized protein DUF4256 n=1 Tax=Mucilaginibacter auburnensis TaxID=1457233 RepID=A0A2H9VUK3_9SPHI|nr:DUF4256 domain-containing protein [Mucilaginibacter auburnensis]PJJ84497.1 uncharacterized protein DUF4256 [Mucilaginibacter auburnensis]
MDKTKTLTPPQSAELIKILRVRFEKHNERHDGMSWPEVEQKLQASPEMLWVLNEMEVTGGEPDVVKFDEVSSDLIFVDCAAESPKGRRSLCYDREALNFRKEYKPASSAVDMANEIGIELLNEDQYRHLQTLGKFDLKTSSWVKTPDNIRKLGGSIFCDRRYDTVFTYHNGAESYYAARGFRGMLKV